MGRIFTYDAVIRRRVPSVEYFEAVRDSVRESMRQTDAIIGGLMLGSLISGDANTRSDVDCLVLYDSLHIEEARSALCDVVQESHKKHVPLQFIPCDHINAFDGYHSLTRSFWTHLEWARDNGGIIKDDPLQYYTVRALGDVQVYIVHKIEMLFTGRLSLLIMSEKEKNHFLQKAIETPIHVARKMLWSKNVSSEFYDKKCNTLEHYAEYISGGDEMKLLQKIVVADARYASLVERYTNGCQYNRFEYDGEIMRIEELLPDIEEFLRMNLGILHV